MLSAVLFGTPGEDSSSIINVGVDDDKHMRIVKASHFELSKVAFKLDIALEEEELGVIFVKDTVRNAGAIDATADLDIRSIVGQGQQGDGRSRGRAVCIGERQQGHRIA